MGCGASSSDGPRQPQPGLWPGVGDRVALEVERRMESKRFPGTMCTKKEIDVGTIQALSTRKCGSGDRTPNSMAFAGSKTFTEYNVVFAHGGNMRVALGRLRRPTADDEASARAVLARLGGDAAASDVRVET